MLGMWKSDIVHACLLQQHPANVMGQRFGRYRDFGLYTDSLAFYGSRMFYYVWDVPIFLAMGAAGGLLGALWVHINIKITALRHRYIPVRQKLLTRPSSCARIKQRVAIDHV